jgi:type IV pilus assembly protein PilB
MRLISGKESKIITSNKIVARFLDGRMLKGFILSFDQKSSALRVESKDRSTTTDIPWEDLKAVFFVREFEGLNRGLGDHVSPQSLAVSASTRHVQVEFLDGEIIQGNAETLKKDQRGFFIMPLDRESNNLRIFVLRTALRQLRVAPMLGEKMVSEGLIMQDDLSSALEKQEEYHENKLGDVIIGSGLSSTEEVRQALNVQKAVNQKLGNILLQADILTEEDLEKALEIQQENHSKRLGEILVEMGVATSESVCLALALKYRLPYVDLSTYPIDPAVVSVVKKDVAMKYRFIPISKQEGGIIIAINDPMNFRPRDYMQSAIGLKVREVLSTPKCIEEAIKQYYGAPKIEGEIERLSEEVVAEKGGKEEAVSELIQQAEDASVVKLVNGIIEMAVRKGASDIHIDPRKKSTVISYRIDGDLRQQQIINEYVHPFLISRIKIMANMNIAERRLPQDGRADMRIGGSQIDLRMSSLPTVFGESIVMRIHDKVASMTLLNDLGFFPDDIKDIRNLISRPYGMLLITGPTGSGKTTTVYSFLQEPAFKNKNIITIEDPVEFELAHVNQIQVRPLIDLTFANALRHILRHDPDVIMVGEIRDLETARIAIQAALTGHLIISTLHTNTAAETLIRLIDIGIEPYLISSTVLGVISQRLVKLICPDTGCRQEDPKALEYLAAVGISLRPNEKPAYYKGKGCEKCEEGYKGRTIIYELMRTGPSIKRAIFERKPSEHIQRLAKAEGMRTMLETGLVKAKEGITTLQEVLRASSQ